MNEQDIPTIDVLKKKIMVTINVAWRNNMDFSKIEEWLSNFTGEALGSKDLEQNLAMWLLYNFVYYNEDEIKHLCKLMLKKYIHETFDDGMVNFESITHMLTKTSFIGLGKSSESGAYVLYLFRQENNLPLRFFGEKEKFKEDENIVFVDDMTLSGTQALKNMKKIKYAGATFEYRDVKESFFEKLSQKNDDEIIKYIKTKLNCDKKDTYKIVEKLNERIINNKKFYNEIRKYIDHDSFGPEIKKLLTEYDTLIDDKIVISKMNRLILEALYSNDIEKSVNNLGIHNWYLLTFIASEDAIKKMKSEGITVISCIVLDKCAKVFSDQALLFKNCPEIGEKCKKMCEYYGIRIKPDNPLGYGNCQYMFGLYYTIPNNTLPIFWGDNKWIPLFTRHEKNFTGGVQDVFGRYI